MSHILGVKTLNATGITSDIEQSVNNTQSKDLTPIKYNHVFKDLFRGNCPSLLLKNYPQLTKAQRQELDKINIPTRENDIYVGGLITVPTKKLTPIDLTYFKENLFKNIKDNMSNKDFQSKVESAINKQNQLHHSLHLSATDIKVIKNQIHESLMEICDSVTPDYIFDQIQYPIHFKRIVGPKIGRMAVAHSKDLLNMSKKIKPLEALIPRMSEKTDIDSWEEEEEQPSSFTYEDIYGCKKDLQKNRQYNDQKFYESKAETAYKIYKNLKIKLKRATPEDKKKLIAYVKSLRPSISELKAYYLAKGESQEVVDKLVNHENYPYLPNVWVTKKQQAALLSVIEDNTTAYNEFIQRKFTWK